MKQPATSTTSPVLTRALELVVIRDRHPGFAILGALKVDVVSPIPLRTHRPTNDFSTIKITFSYQIRMHPAIGVTETLLYLEGTDLPCPSSH